MKITSANLLLACSAYKTFWMKMLLKSITAFLFD